MPEFDQKLNVNRSPHARTHSDITCALMYGLQSSRHGSYQGTQAQDSESDYRRAGGGAEEAGPVYLSIVACVMWPRALDG